MISQSQRASVSQRDEFETLGYTVFKGCVSEALLKETKQVLVKNIEKCANDLGVDFEEYLSSVSRWGPSSIVTKKPVFLLRDPLSRALFQFFEEKVMPTKWNVICKNAYNTRSVPFHQDICYSPHQPYQVSAWLALDDVDEQSGPLAVREGSHQKKLKPAVDFWSPSYTPSEGFYTKIPVQRGDLILFDSCLWHGSAAAEKKMDRYAFVSRWSCQSYEPPRDIPAIEKAPFGMWTCQEETQRILTQGSWLLHQKTPGDFVGLLEAWITYLRENRAPFKLSVKKAIVSLNRIKILHLAYEWHDGGDASGTLYKELWENLLQELQNYINGAENEKRTEDF